MQRHVLVPIDGSASALRALDHAIEGARRESTTLHLLNVEPPLDDYGMVGAFLSRAKHRTITAERASDLLAPAIERAKRARVRYADHVVWGDAAASIDRTARRLRCASIVMGTRGMGATANLMLGSVATKVIHLSKVPVTLVK